MNDRREGFDICSHVITQHTGSNGFRRRDDVGLVVVVLIPRLPFLLDAAQDYSASRVARTPRERKRDDERERG